MFAKVLCYRMTALKFMNILNVVTNTFGKIAVDQTLEETINKDTQTAGGTKKI